VINEDKLGDFFMMDGDDEAAEYGAAGNYARAAELGADMLSRTPKAIQNAQSSKFKTVMDFKVRVMEFISMYVKKRSEVTVEEKKDSSRTDTSLTLIKGLLGSLKVAH